MNYSITLLTLTAFALSATARVQAQEKSPDYYPFTVGTKWHYQVDPGNGVKVDIINHLAEIEKIDGISMARIETTTQGQVAATEHMSQTEKGLFRRRFGGGKISPPIQLLKYPIKKGEQWESKHSIAGQSLTSKCTVDLAEVTVPAGKYKAVKVVVDAKQAGNNISTTYWFVENVGIVKQTVSLGETNVVISLEKFEKVK